MLSESARTGHFKQDDVHTSDLETSDSQADHRPERWDEDEERGKRIAKARKAEKWSREFYIKKTEAVIDMKRARLGSGREGYIEKADYPTTSEDEGSASYVSSPGLVSGNWSQADTYFKHPSCFGFEVPKHQVQYKTVSPGEIPDDGLMYLSTLETLIFKEQDLLGYPSPCCMSWHYGAIRVTMVWNKPSGERVEAPAHMNHVGVSRVLKIDAGLFWQTYLTSDAGKKVMNTLKQNAVGELHRRRGPTCLLKKDCGKVSILAVLPRN